MSYSNALNPRETSWDVNWKSGALNHGVVNEVDPSDLKLILKPIWRGTTGGKSVKLGDRYKGVMGQVKIKQPDLQLALFLAACPWATVTTNQIAAPSAINVDLYSYAGLLNLHPHDLGNTNEDLNFVMACPSSVVNMKRDGDTEDLWVITYEIYPDRAKLLAGKLIYYYIGATVPSDAT